MAISIISDSSKTTSSLTTADAPPLLSKVQRVRTLPHFAAKRTGLLLSLPMQGRLFGKISAFDKVGWCLGGAKLN